MKKNNIYLEIDNDLLDKVKKISGTEYAEIRIDEKTLVDKENLMYMLYDLLDELDYQKDRFEERENKFKTMYSDDGLQTRIYALEGALNEERKKRQALEEIIKKGE